MDKVAQEKWRAAFDACDINGNGFIEPSELPKVFEKLNVKLDDTSKRNLVCGNLDLFVFILIICSRSSSLIKIKMESSLFWSLRQWLRFF